MAALHRRIQHKERHYVVSQRTDRRPPITWIGFRGKTVWDWIQLLLIPGLLSGGALFFNDRNAKTQLALSTDRQREAALQGYIDDMSSLLLDQHLHASLLDSDVRNVARTRTISVLSGLDASRKRTVLQFLQETQLISATAPILRMDFMDFSGLDLFNGDLAGLGLARARFTSAVLTGATLSGTNLTGADMTGAKLPGATMIGVNLTGTDLSKADLSKANLTGANLTGASLAGATLTGATVTAQQLATVRSLTSAILPDGTTHE